MPVASPLRCGKFRRVKLPHRWGHYQEKVAIGPEFAPYISRQENLGGTAGGPGDEHHPAIDRLDRPAQGRQLLFVRTDAVHNRTCHHCQLVYAPPYLGIRDLGSRNGTYLNGKKVDAPLVALVKPENDIEGEVISQGDLLTVGGTTFKIEIAECPPLWTGLRQVES
jgi:hypothetical protein